MEHDPPATTAPDRQPSATSAKSGDPAARTVLDETAIRRVLVRIAHEIVERHADMELVYIVAIPNGGVPLARLLVENLRGIADTTVPLGILDTTLYRDDLATRGERPQLRVTEMPSSVDDRAVILVEDVVNTGRTIRAAMDALMDFGRPRIVQVVALVDRGHRELPIKIDYVGKNIPTQPEERVRFAFDSHGAQESDGLAGGGGSSPPCRMEVLVEVPAARQAASGDGNARTMRGAP